MRIVTLPIDMKKEWRDLKNENVIKHYYSNRLCQSVDGSLVVKLKCQLYEIFVFLIFSCIFCKDLFIFR